ncbi:class I adenylate-forming enzyme family protein [Rhodopila sp.]|uniref:class I adenylate-forming enzyme family protein n=1 Tax=Rhodopila sp. TaxID=2480087 RepID=UPI003D10BBBF
MAYRNFDPGLAGGQDSTCRCLGRYARRRPAAIAVEHRGVRVTYQDLAAHVLAVMDDLTAAGVRRGQVLGVELGDRLLHLLILLAAEALGVPTLSLTLSELGPPAHLDRLCARIIVSHPLPASAADKRLAAPLDWLTDVRDRPVKEDRLDELDYSPEPDAMVRLIKSSGTTGVPKVMGMIQRVQQGVIQKAMLHAPDWVTSHPDYLCLYNFAVRASHARALLTLQLGGTIHLTGADVMFDLIAAGVGNYAMFVAGDLERCMRAAPHGGPFRLYLDVIGAAVPPRLRQEARARLTEHMVVTYSSNEVNRISIVDADDVGTLFPDVRVRIVDEHGKPMPMGQPGLIRVRTDTMTDGYLDAPELTRSVFVNGWFHTSDVGFQPSKGKLVVLGRADDMLNIGGLKIAPGPIEQRLKAIDGIHDALVTSIDDHLETRVMLVAIETTADADRANLVRLVTPIIRAQVTYFQLVVLPAFPRTETGKVRREAVKELYRRQAAIL